MKNSMILTIITLLITIILIPQFGCNGETEEPEAGSNRWLELLNILPANDKTLKRTYLQDFTYVMDELEQYPQITDRYAVSHIGSGSPSSLFSRYNFMDTEIVDEYKDTLGFTFDNVDQIISSGEAPYDYEAYRGNFNKTDIDNAVKTGPLNDKLEIVQYGGFEFYSWGEDNEVNLSLRSNVRPTGKGHRLALVDDFIFWMSWTDGVEDMIDSHNNKIDSLADIEEYQLMASELTLLDVFHAYFSMDTNSYSDMTDWLKQNPDIPFLPTERQRIEEAIENTKLLQAYQAFATGVGIDEQGFYLAIVLVNSDDKTARSNASLLENRIKETKSVWQENNWLDWIDRMEIKSKGRLTTAKLYGAICEFWWERLENLDPRGCGVYEPLLLHE